MEDDATLTLKRSLEFRDFSKLEQQSRGWRKERKEGGGGGESNYHHFRRIYAHPPPRAFCLSQGGGAAGRRAREGGTGKGVHWLLLFLCTKFRL